MFITDWGKSPSTSLHFHICFIFLFDFNIVEIKQKKGHIASKWTNDTFHIHEREIRPVVRSINNILYIIYIYIYINIYKIYIYIYKNIYIEAFTGR